MTPGHHALVPPRQSPLLWLDSYPAHLSRTWTLASGESLRVRPVRHDDGALEEAFVRGLSQAVGVVLATNVAMLRLARSMGFAVNAEPGDATVRRISRPLAAVQQH